MKIVIEEARAFVNADKTGIGKFYLNTLQLLSELGYEPIRYEKKFLLSKHPVLRRIMYFIWLNTVFLFKLLMLRDDVIVIGANYYVPFIKLPHIKYYPVIYDLTAVEYSEMIPKWNAFVIKLITENAIRNGDNIITISEASKNAIIKRYNYPAEQIKNVTCSASLDKNITKNEKEILTKFNIKEKKYILSVSSLAPYKNIKALSDAFNLLDDEYNEYSLVLVGKNFSNIDYNNNHKNNIILTGYVEEEELKVLYKNAAMYVFPSLSEGFGIPIIDSQLFGIPVICSDIPVFREVAGDGALFCEPTPENIKNCITELINNPETIQRLIQAGTINAKKYDNESRKQLWKNALEENK